MKTYELEYISPNDGDGMVERPDGTWLNVDEVFTKGPDGKRHPTQEEIDAVILGRADRDQEGYVHEMLDRLSTVAPKEE